MYTGKQTAPYIRATRYDVHNVFGSISQYKRQAKPQARLHAEVALTHTMQHIF